MQLKRSEVKKLRSSQLHDLINSQLLKYLTAFVSILFFFPVYLFADIGETGASFLNLDVGACAIAMGGAAISLSTGVHALYWNPGGLGWLDGTEITFMHSEHFQSIRHENFGLAHSTNICGLGFSVKGLFVTGLEERTLPSPNPLSTFGAYFVAPAFSLAKAFGNNISFGTNIKLIYQKIGDNNATSLGDDIGISIKSGIKGLKFGFALTNIGTKMEFIDRSFSLPSRARAGFGYSLFNENLIIAFDVLKPFNDRFEYRIGAGATVMENVCLRFGYKSGLQDNGSFAGFASGVGIRVGEIDVDYAFSAYGTLGLTHSFSISYTVGEKDKLKEEEEIKITEELDRRARLTAQTFYQQGIAQENAREYEVALRSFDIALIWDPGYEEAVQHTNKLKMIIKERSINEHLTKGVAEFNHDRYIESISEFGQVLELDKENEKAKVWLKTASDALVKLHMERIQLEKELEDKISNFLKEGLENFSKKRYKAAIDEWNRILSLDPTHKEALEYIGKAKVQITKQVTESLNRAKKYITDDKLIEALNELNLILNLEPSNAKALVEKEEVKEKLKIISKDHTQQGIKYYKNKKYGLAETEFKLALNFDHSNLIAKNYLKKTKPGKKEISGGDINDLYMKGVTAYTQEKYPMAIFYWKRVLEIDPKHSNAKRNIARAEEKLKIYKK